MLRAHPNMTLTVKQILKILTLIFELCYLFSVIGFRPSEKLGVYHIKYALFIVISLIICMAGFD